MSDKIMLNFRCPTEVLEAIDSLGKERYPANTKHGCDRSKTLMDIMRAGIEALNDGSVVLPAPAFVRQQPYDVRHNLSDSLLDARITEIVERKTERLQTALAELRAELVGESVAVRENNDSGSLRQQLAQTQEQLAITTQEFEEAKTNNQRWRDAFKELEGERDNLEWQVGALRDENQRLQADIRNLQQEPKETDADFAKLQESSALVINNLREDLRLLQSRLAEERVERESLQKQLDNGAEQNPASANTQQPAAELGLPEAADLLNQLKAKRKKSRADLADVEEILEILGGDIN
jgi:chromosome segregation ATPase